MSSALSRRQFLAGTAAVAGGLLLPAGRAGASPATLTAERRTLDINGKAATVFGISGPDGRQGLTLGPDERFRVRVVNRLFDPTIIHWHGMTPPQDQDGVALHGVPLIEPGDSADYDFAPAPGTHWMHSHSGFQEQQLLAAPLIVRTREDVQADEQEVVVLLHDFTFRDPAELLAEMTGRMVTDHGVMGAMVEAPAGRLRGLNYRTWTLNARAERAPGIHLHDTDFDAYLANDRTLDDPDVVRVEPGGRVRLRVINAASATAFWLDLAGLKGTVVAADGLPVVPVAGERFPMAMGQRLDIRIELPPGQGAYPIFAIRQGDRIRTGIVLATAGATVPRLGGLCSIAVPPVDLSLEQQLVALKPLAQRPADIRFQVRLTGDMTAYVWSLDDKVWAAHRPLWSHLDQRVAIDLLNDTDTAHPMHLHGHAFQVVGINGRAVAGAMRDTVDVPPAETVSIAFDADNAGAWLFHCHNLYHMMAGMMTEVVYLPRGAKPPVMVQHGPAVAAPGREGDFLLPATP